MERLRTLTDSIAALVVTTIIIIIIIIILIFTRWQWYYNNTQHTKIPNHWVMHPVARVSTNICRNLRTQQMSVLVLLCTSYTTCFGPYWWPSSGGFVTQKSSKAVTVYVNGSVASVC
jgi:hypothetical protein